MQKKGALSYLNSVATIIIAFVFFLFPVFFLTVTTDFFTFPKQLLVIFASLLLFVLWGIKVIAEKKVNILSNPLNLPVFLFIIIVILSTVFSSSKQDSLLQMIPVALIGLFFFAVVNFISERSSFAIVLMSLILGSAASSLLSILANYKIYVLPFEQFRNPLFNTHGAPIQYMAFIAPMLLLCAAALFNIIREKKISKIPKNLSQMLQVGACAIFILAIVIAVLQIITSAQKPVLLPFNNGFQVAFAAISQDGTRVAQSLLVGSGYGTFSNDFTRFVATSFNANSFWNLTFSFSSSYILELLATVGVLGLFAFAFIFVNFVRSKKSFTHPLFLATFSVFVLSLAIPFSYSMVFLIFALLALYVSHRSIENAKGFENAEINLVAFKKGLISLSEEHSSRKETLILPVLILVAALATSLYVMFYLTSTGTTPPKGYISLINSDIKFAKSFSPDALKNGIQTYNLQTQAIAEFPYRSDYYRLFSQINLALAANLVSAQKGKTPTSDVQQNIINLLQQSINSARQAVTLSPLTVSNWQNLGQIYRNLIGVGQNAEQFAIASYNQAVALNPSNPALRIELGGIYYQLKQWDLAQNQFTVATQLKTDYANAYYNLGHVLEEKNDLQNALSQYQIVKQLVANDKANTDKINGEIKLITDKIGAQDRTNNQAKQPTADTTPLGVDRPVAEFPPKDPRVKIPEPPEGVIAPSPTESVSPTPTGEANPSPTVTQ